MTTPTTTRFRRRERRIFPRDARTEEEGRSLEEMTRTELYERAREIGVRGRSNMNKAQLVRAIRSHH